MADVIVSEAERVYTLPRPGGVLDIRWSRPDAANAFDEPLVEELLNTLSAARDNQTRVLTLAGDGGRFSAGFDLRGEADDRALAWRFARAEQLLASVRAFPGVTVACVSGPAFGMGADLVAASDYRLGDARARFRFPGPRFGVVLGTDQLRLRVGAFRAADILLRDEEVDAQTALRDGLLTHVLEADEQHRFVSTLADDIQGLDSTTLRDLLRVLRPADADTSLANLTRSTHRDGLARRIEAYRAATLPNRATT